MSIIQDWAASEAHARKLVRRNGYVTWWISHKRLLMYISLSTAFMYHVQIMNISGKAIQQSYKSSRHSYKMVHQQQLSALLVVVVY